MFSIHTSAYNLDKEFNFDWRASIANWCNFLFAVEGLLTDQINVCVPELVVVTTHADAKFLYALLNSSTDEFGRIKNDKINRFLKIVPVDMDFSQYDFDGKFKDIGLKNCLGEFCICLDLDEQIPVENASKWVDVARQFSGSSADGLMIPSVDLYGSDKTISNIGSKWYLIKNRRGVCRGIPNFAKLENGKIDISKSDTTEPIYKDGNLINYFHVLDPRMGLQGKTTIIEKNLAPFVIHRGYEDFNLRIQQNKFWKPHWENRRGGEVSDIVLTVEDLQKREVFPINLSNFTY